jgi:hypothetical protein
MVDFRKNRASDNRTIRKPDTYIEPFDNQYLNVSGIRMSGIWILTVSATVIFHPTWKTAYIEAFPIQDRMYLCLAQCLPTFLP